MIVSRDGSAPCKDCQDRHRNCHSECERYIEYKEQLKVARQKLAEDLYGNGYYGYSVRMKCRIKDKGTNKRNPNVKWEKPTER